MMRSESGRGDRECRRADSVIERHTKPIVVYDGECAFCRRQIARIRRQDRADVFEYTPRQTPGLDEAFPELARGDFNTGMRLIMPTGRIYVGADAVYRIVRQLPVWRRVAWLYHVPGLHAAARAAYAFIAARRQRLGRDCVDETCAVPREE
jgi:predicted DCC family thiol-disulfide oxidoreductase YuxK